MRARELRSSREEGFRRRHPAGLRADGLVDLDGSPPCSVPAPRSSRSWAVNNEIGTIQPLAEIAALCRAQGRCPLRRGAGRRQDPRSTSRRWASTPVDLRPQKKLYGPKGLGALYVRRRPRVGSALIDAAARSGASVRAPCRCRSALASARPAPSPDGEMGAEAPRLLACAAPARHASQRRARDARQRHPERRVAGKPQPHLSRDRCRDAVESCDQVAISTGSACSRRASSRPTCCARSASTEAAARASVRIGIGRFTRRRHRLRGQRADRHPASPGRRLAAARDRDDKRRARTTIEEDRLRAGA